ncbi:actin-like ATPase domain-containing protein [Dothidotthia symphoricarpi CBS 119687]|uniref:Actin-like ATPase domain-containing protein n=1 Tax=Dothidotthia symphoricarpi CBS 119687 TaxID=1392245 RepID=A0A6A6AR68_9PLEO|nr:actin-like ATPase domain-containing protein [Dothidotthia symphoricarpi CBS 119687]KAF2133703.1 actin-like ATPase domain-containing protein [Dothidotthia symphoricarpi CBS 119687]
MSAGERKPPPLLGRSIRGTAPRLADLASTPELPRTPLSRSTSSQLYGSPGAGFRTEDECVVVELGARFVRGGFPGESTPRCTLPFGPEQQRRVGDYRQWEPAHAHRRHTPRKGEAWGQEHELYRLDLTGLDLGLVEDRFERAMREAYTKYFLLDSKPRRVLLALPPRMPHALMSTLLDVLFSAFHAPTVTLMSSPVLSTVAAGLRSALVVDIGWAETLVTAVCEYREVHERRSIRAGKLLSEDMAALLNAELDNDAAPGAPRASVSFEEADEVLTRVAWCKPYSRSNRRTVYFPAREAPVLEEFEDAIETAPPTVTIPFPKHTPPTHLKLPFALLAKPVDRALFVPDSPLTAFDDHDLPLHHLIHRTLIHLPIDVRRLCMSRIVITGGVSHLPGLKTRILQEVDALLQTKGWDPVSNYGSASAHHEEKLRAHLEKRHREAEVDVNVNPDQAAHLPHDDAPFADKLAALALNPPEGGSLRAVESLGAWAGASLVAQQRIRGIVEVERERFLKEGLHGASREREVSVVPQRQSVGPGVARGAGERASWTLGVWA